ncbi:hypothetical protein BH24GEM1_BH24GEM1_07430 [soil metagenome]
MEQVPSIQVVRQSVPDELEDAVMQALEKTPADRFQKMSEFAEVLADLEPTLATRRTTSRGVPAMRRSTPGSVPRSTPGAEKAVSRTTPVAILGEKWGTGTRLRSLSAAGLALLVAAAIGVWRFALKPDASAAADSVDKNRIAVLYFENRSGADSLTYLADGLTEALIQELSEVKPLQVISRNGVSPFRKLNAPLDSVGRALKVGTLVEGTVAQSGERLRVSVSMINAATGDVVGSKTLERPRSEIFALQDDLAKEVSVFLRQRLGQEIELERTRVGTGNTQAWELLQQAEKLSKDLEPLLAAGDTVAAGRRLAQADSLLAAAEKLDPTWVTLPIQRGWVAYHQTDLIPDFNKEHYGKWTQLGLVHANRALELKPGDAEGLELKGTLNYFRWLLNLEPAPGTAAKLVASAEADLRSAVTAKPTAAWAWTLLSHLLIGQGQTAEAKLAALRSYEADPYLSSAKQTLYRLFSTSYDTEDRVGAKHWCDEGYRRFPDYHRFTECQLSLLGMPGGEKPDIPKAWELLDQFVRLTPVNRRPYHTLYGQLLLAMALVRAELPDSARAVALRSRGNTTIDPTHDLAYFEALVRTQLGDRDEAFRLLGTYLASNPQMRAGITRDETWLLRDLRSDPRFATVVGTRSDR